MLENYENTIQPTPDENDTSKVPPQQSVNEAQPAAKTPTAPPYAAPSQPYQNTYAPNPFERYPQQASQQTADNYGWNLTSYDVPNAPQKPKKSGNVGKIVLAIVACAVIMFGAGFGLSQMFMRNRVSMHETTSTPATPHKNETDTNPDLVIHNKPADSVGVIGTDGELTGEMVYEKVSPSVVGIIVYTSAATDASPAGEGSGIILSADGYIVTNEHVVEDAQLIEVVLSNKERYTAKLMGYDVQTDLAVIKIDAENLVAAELGNSDELKPGEVVYAIGNPGGLEFANSITNGIVSGTDRLVSNSSTGYVMTCIQTNAAINPGNSGGALADRFGRVIGINVAKLSDVDYEGMGFAIPISASVDLIDNLIEYGYVKGRPKLGITYTTISSAAANFYGLPSGIRVANLDPESDAYKKGLKTGDIITAIDGEKLNGASDVLTIMGKHKAGETITLTVYRQGAYADIAVVLGENDGRDTSTYISTDGSSFGQQQQQQQQNPYGYGNYDSWFGNSPFGNFFE